jgi:hypothetical protein
MTATSSVEAGERESRRPPGPVLALGFLLVLLVIGALQGGWAMVTNPVDPLGMSLEFLEDAPVDDYFWPGMFLLGIALASSITVVGLARRWDWRWAAPIEKAVGFRWPWIGAMAVGIVLLAFEIAELFLVPFHPVMHPLLIAGSLAIVILTSTRSARQYLSVDR